MLRSFALLNVLKLKEPSSVIFKVAPRLSSSKLKYGQDVREVQTPLYICSYPDSRQGLPRISPLRLFEDRKSSRPG